MNYLLDTNIALAYLRKANIMNQINNTFAPFALGNTPIMSVVSLAELYSLALRNAWGEKRVQTIQNFENQVFIADINVESIISRYAEIDAFSQGKHPLFKSQFSARNMGKNDIWIAATASVLSVSLLTLDKDFDHLHHVFCQVITISS